MTAKPANQGTLGGEALASVIGVPRLQEEEGTKVATFRDWVTHHSTATLYPGFK